MFYDTLVRTAGLTAGGLNDSTALFTSNGARSQATTNLINGSTLPSDQSHVVLALRCFTWFRNSIKRIAGAVAGEVALNGDYSESAPWLAGPPAGAGLGQAPGQVQDVYRLHFQTEEQLHWSFGTGLKNSIDNMPTWYFPAGKFFNAAGVKPTSNGESSDQSQRRAERCGNAAKGLETCTQPHQVKLAAKCGAHAGAEPAALNGRHTERCEGIVRSSARAENQHGRNLGRHGRYDGSDPLAEQWLRWAFGHTPARTRDLDPAEAEHPLHRHHLRVARQWSRWRFRNEPRQQEHAVAAGQSERHRRGAEGHHLHVRRSEQAVSKPTSNGETCIAQAIPCRASARAGDGRRDLCAALPGDAEREARSGAGGRTQPAKRWARRRAVVAAQASGVMG